MKDYEFNWAIHGRLIVKLEQRLALNQIAGDNIVSFSFRSARDLGKLLARKERTLVLLKINLDKIMYMLNSNTEMLDYDDLVALTTLRRSISDSIVTVSEHIALAESMIERMSERSVLGLIDDALNE